MQKTLINIIFMALFLPFLIFQASAGYDASSGRTDVMAYSGSFNQTIGIPVASGRAGVQPSLTLSYSSSMGNGLYGYGWDLGISRIERKTKKGAPSYTSADKFVLVMNGARQTLVHVGSNEYRTANEGAFLKITKTSGSWTVKDKNNSTYVFSSRWPASGVNIFSWSLSRVTNANNQVMTYNYVNDGRGFRISSINYPPNNRVAFTYDYTRADKMVSYRSGYKSQVFARLINVKSFAGASLASHVSFEYTNLASQQDYRSLLSKYNVHDITNTLPAQSTSYQYQRKNISSPTGKWNAVTHGKIDESSRYNNYMTTYSPDLNADGKVDKISIHHHTRKSKGKTLRSIFADYPANFKPEGSVIRTSLGKSLAFNDYYRGSRYYAHAIVDINGDGYLDWFGLDELNGKRLSNSWKVRLNTGKRLSSTVERWRDPGGSGGYRAFYDVNGDGLPDLLKTNVVPPSTPNTYGAMNWTVYLNMGTYFNTAGFTKYLSSSPVPAGAIHQSLDWRSAPLMTSVINVQTGMTQQVSYVLKSGIAGAPKMKLWTVNNLKTSGPGIPQTSVTYSYSGGVYNLATQEFRGFRTMTELNNITNIKTVTTYLQDIVAYGRPKSIVTSLNGVVLSSVNNTWDYQSYYDGRINFPYINQSISSQNSLNGSFVKQTVSNFKYDNFGNLLTSRETSTGGFETMLNNTYSGTDKCALVPVKVAKSRQVKRGTPASVTNSPTYRENVKRASGAKRLAYPQRPRVVANPTAVRTGARKKRRGRYSRRVSRGYRDRRAAYRVQLAGYNRYISALARYNADVRSYPRRQAAYQQNAINYLRAINNRNWGTYAQAYTKTIYVPDPKCWKIRKLTKSVVTKRTPTDTKIRTSTFAYNAKGLLTTETIEPNIAEVKLVTRYVYDNFGNRTTTTVSGAGITPRTTRVAYDAQGMFPKSTTNAMNHKESYTWDARFGKKLSLKGPNGLTTSWTLDGFGRKTRENRADGTFTAIDLSQAPKKVTTTASGSNPSTVWYDSLGRQIKSESTAFDGSKVYTHIRYNAKGQKVFDSLPSTNSVYIGAIKGTSYGYDALGRVISVTSPDGKIRRTSYNGLTTVMTNAKSQKTTTVKNTQGQVVSVKDAMNQVMTYAYDANGNLISTKDALGNTTTMTYDIRGRKTSMTDPDMGYWRYEYDVLGNLIRQTNAKGQVTTMAYDKLGRMVSRTEVEGRSTWVYDTKWVGALSSEAGIGSSKSYTYDGFGRVNRSDTTINGRLYTVGTTYDTLGRVDTITYPTGVKVRRNYNAAHYFESISNVNTGQMIWQATDVDIFGRTTGESFGNNVRTSRTYDALRGTLMSLSSTSGATTIQNWSYDYDAIGNMNYRTDHVAGYTENYEYDALNRLFNQRNEANVIQKAYRYNAIGNITYSSNAGHYTYDPNHKHAVRTAGSKTYAYDANGNMLTGGGRTLAWTSFNKPSEIWTASGYTRFTYDANHNRVTKKTPTSGTHYVGKLFEYSVAIGGVTRVTKNISYIYAGSKLVSQIEEVNGFMLTKYMHGDHLGSINVITDEWGAVLSRSRFDAFGKPVGAASTQTTRGYTGHEMDASTGLINMNARLYDPILGRFISADTIVPSPGNMQDFNRYSYVLNNPLYYTDPTGHSAWTNFRDQMGRQLITWAVSAYLTPIMGPAAAYGVGGFVSSAAYGGNSGQNVTAGVMTSLTFVVGHGADGMGSPFGSNDVGRYAAHGALSGFSYVAAGGNFGTGFTTGFVSSWTGEYIGGVKTGHDWSDLVVQTTLAGMVGGVTSQATGGSFEEGFRRGAEIHAYNSLGVVAQLAAITAGVVKVYTKIKATKALSVTKVKKAPENLQEQMTLDAAKQGAGRKIIDSLNDPRFKGFEKWHYSTTSDAGRKAVVHYVRDPKSGKTMDYKFK